jgi:hypothetical protein
MIGFDSIGQAAIGELTGDANDVLIFVPAALSVSASVAAPAVAGGGSAAVPALPGTAALQAPTIRAGVRVDVPSKAATAACTAGSVQISATVTVPDASATAAIVAPRLNTGVLVELSGVSAAVTITAPFVTAGKTVAVPGVSAAAALPSPLISIGNTVRPGPLDASAALVPPSILCGNYIEVSNTITMSTPYGEIGSGSIGEFAIGEGEPSTRTVRRGLLSLVSIRAPFITAGKSILPTTIQATASLGRPEIDSRLHKIRLYAIAS